MDRSRIELVDRLDASRREDFEERAAIMQFEGTAPVKTRSVWRCWTF